MPEATIRTYLERGLAFSQGYGMTEASPGVLYPSREASSTKAGTAGVTHFFTDVRLLAADGDEAAPGDKGEILVSDPNVMSGYGGRPDDTAQCLRDGWFHSGDVGITDEDGYVSIVDRVKDVIISGGEAIYRAEVEAVLYDHPAVAECAVIRVPDEKWGEVGRAVIVPKADAAVGEHDLLEFLGTRLARYKIPKAVVFAPELPRNATGKLLKQTIRARYGKS